MLPVVVPDIIYNQKFCVQVNFSKENLILEHSLKIFIETADAPQEVRAGD